MSNLTKTNNKKDRGKTEYFTALIFTTGAHHKQLIFKTIKYQVSLRPPYKQLPSSDPAQIGREGVHVQITG